MSEVTLTKKSGKGLSHGVISELTAFFAVKPGHADELRAACERFNALLLNGDQKVIQKIGLRDTRLVVFDNGQRLLWITGFETDWDPYIDDAIMIIGKKNWVDWMQHLVEYPTKGLNQATNAEVKAFMQSGQVRASCYFNSLPNQTGPEIQQALQVEQVFQQVLDDPAAAQALQVPALKPLLEEAAV